jgi:hypothetical protein
LVARVVRWTSLFRRLAERGAQRAGHTSVSFVLDRHGYLFPEADTALPARLDDLFRQ